MATDNRKIEKLLDQMKDTQSTELATQLTEALAESHVYVPAIMPRDTKPEALRKMMENPGVETAIPEGAQPQPCILQNDNGMKFFPIFTSEEEMQKGKGIPAFPITLNVPFKTCVDIMESIGDITAAAINPFNQNIVMNISKNATKKTKLTESQYHAIIRQQMEARVFPDKIHTGGEEYINDLCERQGECIMELFEEPYAKTNNCPYTADDYDFMILNISDTLRLIRITMPTNKQYPEMALSVFIAWNPVDKVSRYFAIIKGREGEDNKLYEVTSEQKVEDLGNAPDEGIELQSIIDLATAE